MHGGKFETADCNYRADFILQAYLDWSGCLLSTYLGRVFEVLS